ncbi:MAG: ATP-binding protein [Prevotella sp.]|jgi:signal transduction histidine kinase|nr:ATP-binding protein [Prevotella sp.]MCI1281327.1 ATP-binding protein [Prevotella sp.]
MKRISVGQRLYIGVIAVFLLFAIAFIIFQQAREKHYKVEMLNLKLQDYNARMDESLHFIGKKDEKTLQKFVDRHFLPNLRVTLIDKKGRVFFDNLRKDYSKFSNHSNRPEVRQALAQGSGSVVDRNSTTIRGDFFYSATYFPSDGYIIRSALPYNSYLSKSLQADRHYLWFAIIAIIILVLLLYRFTNRLGKNITKLRIFANRADHNESLEVEDLIDFPNDELGEIAEKIIKIYKRLQTTREEQNVLKRQLTQNVAHELKTPVASIQGYLETIQENPNIDEATKEQFLDRCYAQSKRLTALLQDISTLNRMDDAPDIKDFTEVDISTMVKNIIKDTSLEMASKKMNFINHLPDGIILKGNQSLLYSVFRNLTDNAIAYAGIGTTITLEAKEEERMWQFAFMDNGVGVPKEHLSRLFERFYRVDKGRSRKMGGTGLGLAIVKNAVILHGGTISVKNNPNGGLRFDFALKK